MVLDLFDSGRVKCVKAARGHTLVEMLAVVAIIALIVGIGLPNLSFWLAQYRLRAAAISLTNHLNAARLLAIFKGVTHQAQIATVDKGNYYQIVADPDDADIVVRGIGRIACRQVQRLAFLGKADTCGVNRLARPLGQLEAIGFNQCDGHVDFFEVLFVV